VSRVALRPYQHEAIASVLAARRAGERRLVVSLPTGAGKTVIFSELARLAKRPVLVIAHRRELVEQARDKIAHALGDQSVVAIEQGATSAHDEAKVVVASVRSLGEPRLARLMSARDFGLVVYDECHHATAEDNRRVLSSLGVFDAAWTGTLLGFTATTVRADGMGLDEVFERIVYAKSLTEMVREGYLAPLRGYRIATLADLSRVTSGPNDFAVEELAEAVDIEERNALVARSIQELARDRRTVAFCVTVRHAMNLARALNAVGVPTGIVHGAMPLERRAETLRDFREGRIAAVTNVGVLTEGFDDPGVSCVAMARPTRSDGLYAQCVGRGTRLAPGKTDCLVLDFVDLSERSLATLPTLVGLPPQIDLEGATLDEAERALGKIWHDDPGFEVDPGDITLGEIQRRAAAFGPLALGVDAEVSAVSANAWESLGSRGLVLHVHWTKGAARAGRPSEVLVLDERSVKKGGKRWRVSIDGVERARFSKLEEAVAAVDFEVDQRGRQAAASARANAAWRHEAVPGDVEARLAELVPKRSAKTHGEALRLLAYAEHGPHRLRRS
jgi:superfamily II DNA or RNA helicase